MAIPEKLLYCPVCSAIMTVMLTNLSIRCGMCKHTYTLFELEILQRKQEQMEYSNSGEASVS